jgi:predicted transcriptional regulator of viral defense system
VGGNPGTNRHRKGIDISKLKDKTGVDTRIISKIASELRKEGRIKSLRRGFYIKA